MVFGFFALAREIEHQKGGVAKKNCEKKSICEEIFAKFNLNIKFAFAMYPFGYSTDVVMGVCWLLVSFVRLTGLTN